MNYQWHYDNLIKTRKNRIINDDVYYEKHHIIMRSMGGTNDKENIVHLTAREHFIAHWLLWRIYRNRQTSSAFIQMCRKNPKHKRFITSSIAYSEARESLKEIDCKGDKNGFFGKKHSNEAKLKMSIAQNKVDRSLMPQHKKGRKLSPESIIKRSKKLFKAVIQINAEGIIINEWNSIKEAAVTLNTYDTHLCAILKGRLKNKYNIKYK